MVCRVGGLADCLSRASTWQGASPYGVLLGRGTVPPRPLRRPTFAARSECALDPGMVPSPTAQVCPLWVHHQVS